MNITKYIIGLLVLLAAGCWQAAGQRYTERRHIRSGNRDYEKLDYPAAEEKYRTAVSKNEASFEAAFNIGDALYKQERFDEAENAFSQILENKALTGQQTAKTLYNLGNAQFAGQKLKEAAESYMRSLIINPDDLEAKYNLAYVQKLLEQQQGGGNNEQDKNNSEQENSENQDSRNSEQNSDSQENDSENRDNESQNNDTQNGEDEQDDNQGDNRQSDQQPKPEAGEQRATAMNREDAEKMLEAMQQQEDKTRDKVEERQTTAAARNGKNW